MEDSLDALLLEIKEFLALPELTRAQRVNAFCERLSALLAPVEAQLPILSDES